MRPMVAAFILTGVVLLGAAGFGAWRLAGWRMGWFAGPPKIASNMWPMPGPVSPSWTRRLRERFPIGSSERDLARTLRGEGFEIDYGRRLAGYGWARYPCVYTLTVAWRADGQGRVREVQGGLLNACTQMKSLVPQRPPRARQPAEPEPALVPGGQSA